MVWFWIVTVGLLMIGTRVSWSTATDSELDWVNSFAQKTLTPAPADDRHFD